MELSSIIKRLHRKREELDRLIASLEAHERSLAAQKERVPKRRGRKFMNESERGQVSERMKRYWASRRAGHAGGPEAEERKQSLTSSCF